MPTDASHLVGARVVEEEELALWRRRKRQVRLGVFDHDEHAGVGAEVEVSVRGLVDERGVVRVRLADAVVRPAHWETN